MLPRPDLKAPAFQVDPYPTYARLRRESPVVMMRGSIGGEAFALMRYADVVNALSDGRFSNDPRRARSEQSFTNPWWMPSIFRAFRNSMVMVDEPHHRRLRDLVHKAFTPRRVEDLRTSIERIADELLSAAAKKSKVDLEHGAGGFHGQDSLEDLSESARA